MPAWNHVALTVYDRLIRLLVKVQRILFAISKKNKNNIYINQDSRGIRKGMVSGWEGTGGAAHPITG